MNNIIILGAGASGLFLAGLLADADATVTIIDKGSTPGRKVLVAGGGKCNFTNRIVTADNYISSNAHYCKSALAGYTPQDFINLVNSNGIKYQERTHAQLFCEHSSRDILDMLLKHASAADIITNEKVISVSKTDEIFHITTDRDTYSAHILVVATGGLALPAAGTSPIGYKIAEKFSIGVLPPQPGLVPLTLDKDLLDFTKPLSGISLTARLSTGKHSFTEQLLFTHRGISGPVTLQISNYWRRGDVITADLLPTQDVNEYLKEAHGNKQLKTVLSQILPARLAEVFINMNKIAESPVNRLSAQDREKIAKALHSWQFIPSGTEGYKTAEVTIGGVDSRELSSKTMEAKTVPKLYFIGEVVDVTGMLGGFNLQWCWSSAWACAQAIKSI